MGFFPFFDGNFAKRADDWMSVHFFKVVNFLDGGRSQMAESCPFFNVLELEKGPGYAGMKGRIIPECTGVRWLLLRNRWKYSGRGPGTRCIGLR